MIQTENFKGGILGHIEAASGFFHGRVEADSGSFRGRVEADSGFLGAVTIEEQAVFRGSILSPNFTLDYDQNSMRRFPDTGVFATGTTPSVIRNAVLAFTGIGSGRFMVDDGEAGGNRIRAIEIFIPIPNTGSTSGIVAERTNGQRVTIANLTSSPTNQALWFRLGTGGKVVRFPNLSSSIPGGEGMIYRTQHPTIPSITLLAIR